MRESNFNVPQWNRACIVISSGLYDRRALDAPAASLPLINSLHHLANLTATSPRIREILAGDGGLERLVRILKHCATGGSTQGTEKSGMGLGEYQGRGEEEGGMCRRARKSPFRAFAEYDLLPTLADLEDLEEADVEGALLRLSNLSSSAPSTSTSQGYTYSNPPSLLLPPSTRQKHLVYTYALAFQSIVNIGVRGSEAIRTRVVEAGALDVVVFVLERYLEDMERRRREAELEWRERERQKNDAEEQERMEVEGGEDGREVEAVEMREDLTLTLVVPSSSPGGPLEPPLPSFSTTNSPLSSVPVSPVPPSPSADTPSASLTTPTAVSRPLLTRLNVVAASSSSSSLSTTSSSSSSSASLMALAPPSRVQTPDTVASMDEAASLTGDENGSTSGREEADEEMTVVATASSSSSAARATATGTRSVKPSVEASSSAEVAMEVDPTDESRESSDLEGDAEAEEDDEQHAASSLRQRRQRTRSHSHSHTTPRHSHASPSLPSPLPPAAAVPPAPSASTSVSGFERAPSPAPSSTIPSSPPPPRQEERRGGGDEEPLHFRDEDVIQSLQLLAYLSKYPHVRAVFHLPSPSSSSSSSSHSYSSGQVGAGKRPLLPPTNIFSLVESFTFRSSSSPSSSQNPSSSSPSISFPSEIQYWAGVIMRNACRKDEGSGGVRQCANMRCGKWEKTAREFAKCRRCRRAKYCSKSCQSEAWNQGHRWWCCKVSGRRARESNGEHASSSSHPHSHAHHHRDAAAADSSNPASGVETPTGPPPSTSTAAPSRHRHDHTHRRRRATTDADEDLDLDEEDDLPPPDAGATPRAAHHPLAGLAPLLQEAAAQQGGAGGVNRERDLTVRPPFRAGGGGEDGMATPPPAPVRDGPTAPAGGVAVAVAGAEDGLALGGMGGMGLLLGPGGVGFGGGVGGGWDGIALDGMVGGPEAEEREMILGVGVGVGGLGGGGGEVVRVPTA
ncbi:hypothetical protein JCM8547_008667 [Rhodosporidiobolus lusitaniae]